MSRKANVIVNGKKYCSRCKREKDIKEFSNAKHNKCGLNSWCRSCAKDYDTDYKETQRKQKAAKKYYRNVSKKTNEFGITKARIHWMKVKYNLSEEQYIEMIKKQDSRCAICTDPLDFSKPNQKAIHIDHCHTTGKVRGILCFHCNRGLGGFRDSHESLHTAIRYLIINQ